MDQIIALYAAHQWLALIIVVLAYLTRITASDSKFPISVPDRWKPVVVLVLGQAYAVAVAVQQGQNWKTALLHGAIVALCTMGAFDVLAKAIWNGNEPAWVKALAGVPAWLRTVDTHEVPTPNGSLSVRVPKDGSAVAVGATLTVEHDTLKPPPPAA